MNLKSVGTTNKITNIEDKFHDEINAFGAFIEKHPEATLIFAGYTDSIGTEEYNLGLSRRRARSVYEYLTQHFQIDPSQIERRKTMKKLLIFVAVGLLGLVMISPAAAEEAGVLKGTENGIAFMTGGVSKGERAEMEVLSGKYNLKVVLATDEGAYLGRLPVWIQDEQGKQILEVETNGPWLYAKLPDGRYTVKSAHGGIEKTRTVQVGEGLEVMILSWTIR